MRRAFGTSISRRMWIASLAFAAALGGAAGRADEAVPFIGCAGDGMGSHADAPPVWATPSLAAPTRRR